MKNKHLNDVFTEWLSGGGIFAYLQELDVPWKDADISNELDLEYHGNISGEKIISPLVRKLCVGDDLSIENKERLANTIMTLCSVNWLKQWETLSAQYNPIENYHMVEQMTDDITEHEYGKSTERTDDLTDENTPNLTTNASISVNGFNSVDAVPADAQEQTATGTNTDTHTGTQTYRDSGKDKDTRNYMLTRSGNIGVTTSQQMLESERKLWMWKYFYSVVFPDIDRVLTLQIY